MSRFEAVLVEALIRAILVEAFIRAMMTAWEDFGCFEGMEADLGDSFMFLSCFMLVFWEDFGFS